MPSWVTCSSSGRVTSQMRRSRRHRWGVTVEEDSRALPLQHHFWSFRADICSTTPSLLPTCM
jgi:hypothetical protein